MALNQGNVSILTLLDLSAAFDTIDHQILLDRLQTLYGISGTALLWLKSYLSGRTQAVTVHNRNSRFAHLQYGVPQGSVLGPILFIMYTKPLSSLLDSYSISNQSFADDTQLNKTSTPDNIHLAIDTTQTCISHVKSWMTQNKLKLNDDKTECLLIKNPNTSLPDPQPTSIRIGSSDIPFASSARNLGYTISDDMTLDKHIFNVCRSAYCEIRKISSIRRFLTVPATNALACAFVLSKLDYCNALLCGAQKQQLYKLQKVQNSAARLVCKARRRDHTSPLLRTLHWLPIEARVQYKLSSLCHHFFSDSAPAYFSDLLTKYIPGRAGNRSGSDSRLLQPPKVKKNSYGYNSFSHRATTQWTSLPYELRHKLTTTAFKSALKTHLFRQN